MALKWEGNYSTDRRWFLQEASIYIGGGEGSVREVRLCESTRSEGGPPYRSVTIHNTRREAKAEAARRAG